MAGTATAERNLALMEEVVREGYRDQGLTPAVAKSFHRFLALFYAEKGRDMPWRRTTDPYRILVSEFMLQQTQVERVLAKYPEFLGRFPDVGSLARAPLPDVLLAWQGLGYNRRALALHRTARLIEEDHGGKVPLDRATLDSFPGIGSATAGAIVVFSTNRPEVFIETNIRRVYIHLFFPDAERVHDREIEPILARTLDRENPRRFYYALMDYGSALRKGPRDTNGPALRRGAENPAGSPRGMGTGNPAGSPRGKGAGNPNLRSASYARQSPFEGSDRQARGIILRELLREGEVAEDALRDIAGADPVRLERILAGLARDGFIGRRHGRIRLQGHGDGTT